PERTGDAARGWKPGMRTSEEILAELREKQNGEGKKRDVELRLEQRPSVVENGLRAREGECDMVRDQARQPGIRSLGEVFSKTRLGADDVQAPGEGGESKRGMDCASSIPRMAARL